MTSRTSGAIPVEYVGTARATTGGRTACYYVRCAPGEVVADVRPGDIILIRGPGWLGRLIRLGARIRYRNDDRCYAHWSHAAMVLSTSGHLVEVHALGVGMCDIEKYRNNEFHYVRLDLSDRDRALAVRYGRSCVGQRYGVSSFLLFCLSLALGDRFRVPDWGQQGCVALIARALQRAGVAFDRAPSDMMPADLAKRFGVLP
jgi:hypothetical protein